MKANSSSPLHGRSLGRSGCSGTAPGLRFHQGWGFHNQAEQPAPAADQNEFYVQFIFKIYIYLLAGSYLVDIYNNFIYRYICVIVYKVAIKGGKIFAYRGLSLGKSVFQINGIRIYF